MHIYMYKNKCINSYELDLQINQLAAFDISNGLFLPIGSFSLISPPLTYFLTLSLLPSCIFPSHWALAKN